MTADGGRRHDEVDVTARTRGKCCIRQSKRASVDRLRTVTGPRLECDDCTTACRERVDEPNARQSCSIWVGDGDGAGPLLLCDDLPIWRNRRHRWRRDGKYA